MLGKIVLSILMTSFLSNSIIAQTTSIPDSNFEQALINLGYDTILDGNVLTANIETVTSLDLWGENIYNLTGIEDFTALHTLQIAMNNITSLDFSYNLALTNLSCWDNNIYSLNLTQNTSLVSLICFDNQLSSLDLSQNIALKELKCDVNSLTCLNVKNGNNSNITLFDVYNNNLSCIEVDDSSYSATNWINKDAWTTYSTNCSNMCSTVGIHELNLNASLNIYPNPVKSILNIELTNTNLWYKQSKLTIKNSLGQIIKTEQLNNNQQQMDVSYLPNGIYFIEVTTLKGILSKKIMVSN